MKEIMIIDGGPRKTFNTAKMIEAFAEGVREADSTVEVRHIRLYDIDYKGCVSCLACKVKSSKAKESCAYRDGLTAILDEAAHADGLVFASPIYFGDITAQLRAFLERLLFPWLSYNDYSTHAPKRVPTAFIYTMNATEAVQPEMEAMYRKHEGMLEMFLTRPERILALNTTQVKDYARYDMDAFSPEGKRQWREQHWESDLDQARDAGARMVKDMQ